MQRDITYTEALHMISQLKEKSQQRFLISGGFVLQDWLTDDENNLLIDCYRSIKKGVL